MQWVKTVAVTEPNRTADAADTSDRLQPNKHMKKLLALAAALLVTAFTTQAQTVSGYFRSNGTYVAPHYRTPANGTPYDNLSYRGYPSQQPGYVSPRSFDTGYTAPVRQPRFDSFDTTPRTLPYNGQSYRTRTFSY